MNTIFLLNEVSLPLVESGESRQGVLHPFGDLAWVKKPERPGGLDRLRRGLRSPGARGGGASDSRGAPWSLVGARGGLVGAGGVGPDFGRKDIVVAQKRSS